MQVPSKSGGEHKRYYQSIIVKVKTEQKITFTKY